MRKFAVGFLLLLFGCVAPGQVIDTPAKRLAAAEAAFLSAVNLANQSIDNGTLDPNGESATLIRGAIISGNEALKAAHLALGAGDLDAFTARIAVARSAISALEQAILQAKEDPDGS